MVENKFPLSDCSSCHFLGHYNNHDLYFCSGECTIIQRYGYNDSEYNSGLVFALSPNSRDVVKESLIRALLIPEYRRQISKHIEKFYQSKSGIFKERLAEANERLLLESYNDRDLPLLVSSLVYESNKKLYTKRLNTLNDPLILSV